MGEKKMAAAALVKIERLSFKIILNAYLLVNSNMKKLKN